jgi:glucose/arabinose dehydrogenase
MPHDFGLTPSRLVVCLALTLPLAACGEQASLTQGEDFGAAPKLPEPANTLLPTVNVAEAVGWAEGGKPKAAEGMMVTAFATGLDHPRTLYVLPNGDVLVAETNAPERPEQGKGIKRQVAEFIMARAGAKTPSANRISLLRDADGDGVAEVKTTFLENLNSPFGMALVGNDFYVANTDAVMRFAYTPGETKITAAGVKLADLPAGPARCHRRRGSRSAHRPERQPAARPRRARRRPCSHCAACDSRSRAGR